MAVQVVDKTAETVSILDKSIVLQITFGRFGDKRRAPLASVKVEADKAYLTLTKVLYKRKEYDAIVRHDAETKEWLRRIAMPFSARHGSYLLPIPIVEMVETELTARAAQRAVLVDTFGVIWSEIPSEMETKHGVLFDPRNFPSWDRVCSRFYVDWQYLDYGVPGRLKAISAAMFEAAREKMEARVMEATGAIIDLMRGGVLALVEHFREKLAPQPEGTKRKRIHESKVKELQEALAALPVKMAAAGDTDLPKIVAELQGIISGVDAKALREDEALRDALHGRFTQIREAMDGMVTERTRRIVLADADENEGTNGNGE